MKRPKISRIALAAALASLGLADFSAGVAAQGVTDKAVKIGAYDALTGPIPLTGKQMSAGWQTAVQAINAAGGINGRTLELTIEDDGYEPSRAMAAARKLVDRDQVLLMTGLGTPTTVVAARYLEQAGVPLLFPMGASSTQLNQAGLKELFMVHPTYSTQADIVDRWDNLASKALPIYQKIQPRGPSRAKKAWLRVGPSWLPPSVRTRFDRLLGPSAQDQECRLRPHLHRGDP